jgi:hypothetical protein
MPAFSREEDKAMPKTIEMECEPTQEFFLGAMRDLGFSEEHIEANRKHNGRLFLTPAVVIGMWRGFDRNVRINVGTGDLVKAKREPQRAGQPPAK